MFIARDGREIRPSEIPAHPRGNAGFVVIHRQREFGIRIFEVLSGNLQSKPGVAVACLNIADGTIRDAILLEDSEEDGACGGAA